jgi:CspA family cold shock protein
VSTATKHGTCKFFGTKGAWGFISPDNKSDPEIFVHISAVGAAGLKGLNAGDRVQYEIETDQRSGRPCAVNLRLI